MSKALEEVIEPGMIAVCKHKGFNGGEPKAHAVSQWGGRPLVIDDFGWDWATEDLVLAVYKVNTMPGGLNFFDPSAHTKVWPVEPEYKHLKPGLPANIKRVDLVGDKDAMRELRDEITHWLETPEEDY